MDPNDTLLELRNKLADRRLDLDINNMYHAWFVETIAEHFQALDDWLSNGGFLPNDWKPKGGPVG